MNEVRLIGNLTKEVELMQTTSGTSVCRFTLAVNRDYTDQSGNRPVDFIPCIAWRKLAETISSYCKKGNKLLVCGSLELRSYKKDGEDSNRTACEIKVDKIEFLTPKDNKGSDYPPQPNLVEVNPDESLPF